MRKMIYVSGARADYGLMSRSLKLWNESPCLDLSVCVTGMHLLEASGLTVKDIEKDGLRICGKVEVNLSQSTGKAMVKAMAGEMAGMVDIFEEERPDMVIVLGDRSEMLAGALAAIHLNIPVVHIHGGERSGTIDEPIRHAISKLSHYHFTATNEARERLIRMGELPECVYEVGAPGLDGLAEDAQLSRSRLCANIGFSNDRPVVLLIFHPVLQEEGLAGAHMNIILDLLNELGLQTVCLMPNTDAGGQGIRLAIESHQQSGTGQFYAKTHFPREVFIAWMKHADAIVGNSSSGIIEAATFDTPVVNVGLRQQGRARNANVCDVDCDKQALLKALLKGLKYKKNKGKNIYGDGRSGQRMLELLCNISLEKKLLNKLNAY